MATAEKPPDESLKKLRLNVESWYLPNVYY